jgi:hypothetical protein
MLSTFNNFFLSISNSPFESPDIEPPPPAPIDDHLFLLFAFGIGFMLYFFYKKVKQQ